MSRRETLRVEISLPQARLDKFLKKQFPDTSRGTFQRLIQNGDVRVDGKTVKPTHQPRAGEEIVIIWPNPSRPRRNRRIFRWTFCMKMIVCW